MYVACNVYNIFSINIEMTNKLINEKVHHKINIKITQFYNLSCRVHQCLKCQEYDHKMYKCKNKQKCIYYMLNHHLKHCFHRLKTCENVKHVKTYTKSLTLNVINDKLKKKE